MRSYKLAALAAFSMVASSSAAIAQSAQALSVQGSPAIERAGAEVEGESQLVGTTAWILAAIALGLIVWGIIELTGDDEPSSP
ncbi:MAG: hypothetical protein ACT4N8_00450 [Sphingosinicella sp.]|uniref:hypothetical protein n=1 Tax=Sphingosinicella sp. TaxID=1917971 RepID=UPI004038046A